MWRRACLIGLVLAASLVGADAALAQALTLDAVNAATFSDNRGKGPSPAMIKVQVLLDRVRFSPGVIDGRDGDNLRKALAAFQREMKLKGTGRLDEETFKKLTALSDEPVVMEYEITAEDVKGPFVSKIPARMEAMSKLDRLAYSSAQELLAEKFHMTEDLLKALNPGKRFDAAGTKIVVANVLAEMKKDNPRGKEKVSRIEVDRGARSLRAMDKDGKLLAFYPASIGSAEKPPPDGEHKVLAVAENPSYTYNPEFKFKGVKAEEKFTIKPGPNNPVGLVWIDLSAETYGIHGTPEPKKVGKGYSHGCVRLTNWDVKELAQMVEKGTVVAFVN